MIVSRALITIAAVAALSCHAQAAITVFTIDVIADGGRTHFNGFESIPTEDPPNDYLYSGGNGPYVEDGIQVQQINGDGADSIAVQASFLPGFSGNHSWLPDGGDNGYTSITLAGGGDFDAVGFNYSSSGTSSNILFELLKNNVVVFSGSAPLDTQIPNYLGFAGGGFDTILLSDDYSEQTSVTSGDLQVLAIDNIETAASSSLVPEPASMAIWGLGILGCAIAGCRRRKLA